MDDNTVLGKTAKGKAEVAGNMSHALGSQFRILLALIDGKSTFDELRKQAFDNVPASKLRQAIEALIAAGYIEIAGSAVAEDNDLDFTYLRSTEPGPQPTREQMAEALDKTLSGMPALKNAGYYVNITNRLTQRILPRSGNKYEVLIIDQEQGAVLLLVRTLMLAGFNVRSAANREEIVVELKKPPLPDALMLDISLPGLNGLDLLARIHQHPQLLSVPIIVITSKSDQEDVAAALARGASGYMTKPCKPEALLDSVHAVLGIT